MPPYFIDSKNIQKSRKEPKLLREILVAVNILNLYTQVKRNLTYIELRLFKKMGWLRRLEPPTSSSTETRSNQLSYSHHTEISFSEQKLL